MMLLRKNQSSLSTTEKERFTSAVLALKNSVPSQMGLPGRYDDYVQMHVDSMTAATSAELGWAHMGPAFLPWHREYLCRFEAELQAIDATVTLPYWDWTVDNTTASSLWGMDLMGGDGRPTDARVTSGPFAFDAGHWQLNVNDPMDPIPGPDLRRRFAVFPNVTILPTATQVQNALQELPYYVTPWRAFTDFANELGPVQPSFCNRLEGWYGLGSIHNRVHLWVGGWVPNADPNQVIYGTMMMMSSPNDPVFWLHHCNLDRLWAEWQRLHPAEPYRPSGTGAEIGPPGHNGNDPMQPWVRCSPLSRQIFVRFTL
jgi:tyrosinase